MPSPTSSGPGPENQSLSIHVSDILDEASNEFANGAFRFAAIRRKHEGSGTCTVAQWEWVAILDDPLFSSSVVDLLFVAFSRDDD